MSKLGPRALFERVARDIPEHLHPHLFVTGSLAAAYFFEAQLEGRAINTKDADLVVHPAGDVASSGQVAQHLLGLGWVRTERCYAVPEPEPPQSLQAIRLYPPDSRVYFIELLNLPAPDQQEHVRWVPIRLSDGWYGLPSFRYLGVNACNRLVSHVGLEYAAPGMMALSNLLSHPGLGTERMSTPIQGQSLLRSAKDLGRAIALAWLAGRDAAEQWLSPWQEVLESCFPACWRELAKRVGSGLRQLIENPLALEEARITTDVGLLSGRGVTVEMLRATAERLFLDVIDPLAEKAHMYPL